MLWLNRQIVPGLWLSIALELARATLNAGRWELEIPAEQAVELLAKPGGPELQVKELGVYAPGEVNFKAEGDVVPGLKLALSAKVDLAEISSEAPEGSRSIPITGEALKKLSEGYNFVFNRTYD